MLVTVVMVALAVAVAARRLAWVRDRMPPPASTVLPALAAVAVAVALTDRTSGVARAVVAGLLTAVLSSATIAVAGLIAAATAPARAWVRRQLAGPSIGDWAVARADDVTWRAGQWNLVAVVVRSVVRAGDVRVTGLAAEMSYYALISLVPLATALGSSLGFLRRLLGDAQVEEIRTSIVDGLTTVFAEQVASDVLAPLVNGLLTEGSAGFAVGALLLTLYLASRVFWAAVRALDDAYRVSVRRHVVGQVALSVVFTIGAVVALVVLTLLVVVGPLVGGGEVLAETFGLSDAFRVSWEVLRWPLALALLIAFLTLLYRYAPNVTTTWRECLPGAVLGTLGVLAVSAAFAQFVRFATPTALADDAGEAAVVQAAAQMLSLVLAGVLWLWLASIAVLVGGILNAELESERDVRLET